MARYWWPHCLLPLLLLPCAAAADYSGTDVMFGGGFILLLLLCVLIAWIASAGKGDSQPHIIRHIIVLPHHHSPRCQRDPPPWAGC
jgi:hypothetical protein